MTYTEKISEMIQAIAKIYDEAEWMRDLATEDEKAYWNKLRGNLYSADEPLRKLNNDISESRGAMEI